MALNEFHLVTDHFYKAEYGSGLPQINRLVREHSDNANLFLNRALFYSQMDNDEQAILDINQSLELNPRNYIGYFNLFSLHFRRGEDGDALDNLLCSLSCLYVLKAKAQKSTSQAELAIKYCFDNLEAHVLRGLLLLQQGMYLQAYCQFEEATAINPLSKMLFELRSCAFQKAYPGQQEVKDFYSAQQYQNRKKRLKSSLRYDKERVREIISQKLIEFNTLYSEINGVIEAFTHRVPRDVSRASVQPASNLSHRRQQKSIEIYDQGQMTPPQSEVRPQPGKVYLRQSQASFRERSKLNSLCMAEGKEFHSIISASEEKDHTGAEDQFQQFESLVQESAVQAEKCDVLEGVDVGVSEATKTVQEARASQTEDGQPNLQEAEAIEECNLIYPLDDHMRLEITILRMEVSETSREESMGWKDTYCIVSYDGGKTKLRTLTQPCEQGLCSWQQTFQPVEIPRAPADMKIKVYNKKYTSFRDEYLGDIEVLITTAELLELPVFSKAGERLGRLLIDLRLRDAEPPLAHSS